MKFIQPILLSAACVLALSACASVSPLQRSSAPAAPEASVKAQPAASGMIKPTAAQVSAHGAANTGGTYPYGTAQVGGTAQGTAQSTAQGTAQGAAQGAVQQNAGQELPQAFAIEASRRANAETTEGVVVLGPDGTVWLRAGDENPAYRGDVDSCYAFARGQVDHDARIERDVASAFDSDAAGFGLTALRGRMNNFERTNRVPALFSSCMSAKGYNRQ